MQCALSVCGVIPLFTESPATCISGTKNEFAHLHLWVFVGSLVCSNVLQITWLNTCIKRFPALFIIPAYQVAMLLYTVIGGGVYFNEFAKFTIVQVRVHSIQDVAFMDDGACG